MPTLMPAFPVPAPAALRRRPRRQVYFAPAPLYDFNIGDFVRDAAGKIIMADGYVAWQQWCIKTLLTQQAQFSIYSRRHGLDLSLSFAQSAPRLVQEAELTRRIRYALRRSPRTAAVVDFEYTYSGATRFVECRPIPAAGAPIPPGSQAFVLRQRLAA